MGSVIEAGPRFRRRRETADEQRRERRRDEFIRAAVAIEDRADRVLRASQELLREFGIKGRAR